MEITDVRLRKLSTDNKLKAVASVTFDNEFVVHEIKVIENPEGVLFIAMPSRKIGTTGEHRDVAHPINPAAREKIQNAILEVYNNTPEPEAKPAEEAPAAE
jgi:stage V sporulation protein G